MSFIGQEPKFFCESQSQYPSGTVYDTTYNVSERSCSSVNNSECMGYRFEDEMHTVVSEVRSKRLKRLWTRTSHGKHILWKFGHEQFLCPAFSF